MSFQIFSLLKKLYRISINLLPILIYFFPLNFFSLRENKRKVKEGSFRALGYVHCSLFMTCFFFKLAEDEGKVFLSPKRHLISNSSSQNVKTFPDIASEEHRIRLRKRPSIPSSFTFNILRVLMGKHEESDNLKDLVIDFNMILKTDLKEVLWEVVV